MKKILASIVACSLVACLGLFLVGCSSSGNDEKTYEVTIGTLATEDILPMWVAEDQDIFTDNGLDAKVEVFQSATELVAAVNSGDVDYAMTDPMVAASIYASGTDVQLEWVTLGTEADQGRFGIMTADDSITDIKDLAGVKIGVGSNTVPEYVMDRLMERAGIPDDQIKTEELQKLPVRYEAMASGQVKAAALPASLLALGESSGFTVVADDTEGDNLSQSVMISRVEFLEGEDGEAIEEAMEESWNDAVELINDSPEDFRALLVEKASLPEPIADSYEISDYPETEMPDAELVADMLSWMKDMGYLTIDVTYNGEDGTFQGR